MQALFMISMKQTARLKMTGLTAVVSWLSKISLVWTRSPINWKSVAQLFVAFVVVPINLPLDLSLFWISFNKNASYKTISLPTSKSRHTTLPATQTIIFTQLSLQAHGNHINISFIISSFSLQTWPPSTGACKNQPLWVFHNHKSWSVHNSSTRQRSKDYPSTCEWLDDPRATATDTLRGSGNKQTLNYCWLEWPIKPRHLYTLSFGALGSFPFSPLIQSQLLVKRKTEVRFPGL